MASLLIKKNDYFYNETKIWQKIIYSTLSTMVEKMLQ